MSKELNKRFGQKLRDYRNDCGLTQEDFAETLQITPQFYANVERGSRAMSMEVLYRLIKFYDVNLNSLLAEEATPADNINDIVAMLSNAPEADLEFVKNMVRHTLKELAKQRKRNKMQMKS